jgi:hypothetical protein
MCIQPHPLYRGELPGVHGSGDHLQVMNATWNDYCWLRLGRKGKSSYLAKEYLEFDAIECEMLIA